MGMESSSSCIACGIECYSLNGSANFKNAQHTCEIGTGTTSEGTNSTASNYTFDNYQDDTGTTAIYPGAGTAQIEAVNYAILGLIGEAGEIANKWKKLFRDAPDLSTHPAEYYEYYANLRSSIIDELGDVQWYSARLATELGASFGEVAASNIRKLQQRMNDNSIKGSGDNR